MNSTRSAANGTPSGPPHSRLTRISTHGYVVVPKWILRASVSAVAKLVYIVLITNADDEGYAHVSSSDLAGAARCSLNTIYRALGELRSLGVVEFESGQGRYRVLVDPPTGSGGTA